MSEGSDGLIGKKHAAWIMGGSIFSALASLLITVLAARGLSVEDNKEFLVFWSLLFTLFGAVAGTSQEATRAVSARRVALKRGEVLAGDASVVGTALMIGAIVGSLLLVTSPLWINQLLSTNVTLAALIVSVGVFAYSGLISLSGTFTGLKAWGNYVTLTVAEAGSRLLLVFLALALSLGLLGVEVASMLPSFVWLLLLMVPIVRRQVRSRADVSTGRLIQNYLHAMVSSLASAILMSGFASMLEFTTADADPAEMVVVILVVTLTRSTVIMPLQAFQNVLITWVTESRESMMATFVKVLGILAVVGACLALIAGLIGPWLMVLVFGSAYQTDGWVIASFAFAAVMMAWLVLSAAICLGMNEHRLYAAGWVVAATTAFLILMVSPGSLIPRALLALFAGPIAGMCVHAVGIRRGDLRTKNKQE